VSSTPTADPAPAAAFAEAGAGPARPRVWTADGREHAGPAYTPDGEVLVIETRPRTFVRTADVVAVRLER
jgi:hypothetical protein